MLSGPYPVETMQFDLGFNREASLCGTEPRRDPDDGLR
jgi:hypothetical protein